MSWDRQNLAPLLCLPRPLMCVGRSVTFESQCSGERHEDVKSLKTAFQIFWRRDADYLVNNVIF